MNEVRWERMFPDELEAAFEKRPVVYLPQGLCEPHGPQNTVGLDALKAHGICCAAAREHGGIVAPADWWHVHEIGHYATWARDNIGEARPWMTSMPPWHHFKNLCYQLRTFHNLGFHACVILTGHYGPNWLDLKTVVQSLQPHMAMRMHGLPDFEVNQPGFDGTGKITGDHAGRVETSLLWAVEPGCVDISRLPAKDAPGPHFAMGGSAYEANRRTGERMARDEAAGIGAIVDRLLAEYEAHVTAENRRSLSFMDVERIWSRDMRPLVPAFASMKAVDPDKAPPPDSQWALNCAIPSDVG